MSHTDVKNHADYDTLIKTFNRYLLEHSMEDLSSGVFLQTFDQVNKEPPKPKRKSLKQIHKEMVKRGVKIKKPKKTNEEKQETVQSARYLSPEPIFSKRFKIFNHMVSKALPESQSANLMLRIPEEVPDSPKIKILTTRPTGKKLDNSFSSPETAKPQTSTTKPTSREIQLSPRSVSFRSTQGSPRLPSSPTNELDIKPIIINKIINDVAQERMRYVRKQAKFRDLQIAIAKENREK